MVKRIAFAALVVSGCALFSEGPPENVCRTDEDCFRAQGEVCDLDRKTCVPGDGVPADAGVDAPADAAADAALDATAAPGD